MNNLNCKYCGSPNVVKFGTFNGIQRYWCKDCKRKFVLVQYTRGCWVKFTRCAACLKGLYSCCNENLRMPDFPLRQFNNYYVKLRPNDWLRSTFDDLRLPFFNYFDSSETSFDLRLAVPNIKENKNLNELVKYEWQLFTESDKPVTRVSDPQYQFYNVAGSGDFEMVTTKPQKAERRSPEYHQYENDDWIMRRKSQAVKIGEYSKLGHYKVVMRFADKSGNWSAWMSMAHFTIVSKDKLRQALFIGIGSALVVLIGTAILHAFGLA